MTFKTPIDIANRALQHVGSPRILSFTDDTKEASEVAFVYDKVRRAELRRNVWRFSVRLTALRALGTDDKLVTFGTWLTGSTYKINDVVTSAADGNIYYSRIGSNTANEPSANPAQWALYFGPVIATEFVTSWIIGYGYAIGDHCVGSDAQAYVAIEATTGNDPTTDGGVHWVVDTTDSFNIQYNSTQSAYYDANGPTSYYAGELVHVAGITFISLVSNNMDIPVWSGTKQWLAFTATPTVALLNFIYPIGAGPYTDGTTKNVYRLPNGFLREAPQNPKAGQAQFLGAPDGEAFADWNFQDQYFVSWQSGVIAFRFAADIADVTQMDDMFCEGLGCRIGEEVCEELTQSTEKISTIMKKYAVFMGEARTVNFIETGPVYQDEAA